MVLSLAWSHYEVTITRCPVSPDLVPSYLLDPRGDNLLRQVRGQGAGGPWGWDRREGTGANRDLQIYGGMFVTLYTGDRQQGGSQSS